MTVKDLPDYTRQMVIKYEGGFVGLEELAIRLGFIGPWDLRGNVILMDDFESELTEWATDTEAGGSSVARSSTHKYSGDWSVKLSIAALVNGYASIIRRLLPPGLLRYGLFARFGWEYNYGLISLYLNYMTGTTRYTVDVDYDALAGTLVVYPHGGGTHTVASDLWVSFSGFKWIPMLVTFDMATKCYDKIYFADVEYDVSGVEIAHSGTTAKPCIEVNPMAFNEAANAWTCYIDDVLLAKNVS